MSSANGSSRTNGHGANGNSGTDAPDWDPEKAQALIGSRVLISITMVDDDEEPVGRWQGYGIVSRADYDEGVIAVTLEGAHEGEETTLPPITSAFEPAVPGTYTLKETGETVEDPDYTVRWTVGMPDDDEDEDDDSLELDEETDELDEDEEEDPIFKLNKSKQK